jgi:hypothetical protein
MQGSYLGRLSTEEPFPSTRQYPPDRYCDLLRRWGRLLQRTVSPERPHLPISAITPPGTSAAEIIAPPGASGAEADGYLRSSYFPIPKC